MPIQIIKPGIFSTIQDLGRNGYRSVGIGPGGAMDIFAASVANYLAGNDANEAVIEMHFPAATISFSEDTIISLTGGDFGATVNDQPVPVWQPLVMKKLDQLSFKKHQSGARIYMAIAGGLIADNWLGSYSTHTKLKVGGYKGRALLKDDLIELKNARSISTTGVFPGITDFLPTVYHAGTPIRCITGAEWGLLANASKDFFACLPFSVSTQSDRMGYRLSAIPLSLQEPYEMVSSPVDAGTIQLLPNGQLIILMADHPTTGGYPRVAQVIGADLPLLAQTPINSNIHFELIAVENATEALLSLYQILGSIKKKCTGFYDQHRP